MCALRTHALPDGIGWADFCTSAYRAPVPWTAASGVARGSTRPVTASRRWTPRRVVGLPPPSAPRPP